MHYYVAQFWYFYFTGNGLFCCHVYRTTLLYCSTAFNSSRPSKRCPFLVPDKVDFSIIGGTCSCCPSKVYAYASQLLSTSIITCDHYSSYCACNHTAVCGIQVWILNEYYYCYLQAWVFWLRHDKTLHGACLFQFAAPGNGIDEQCLCDALSLLLWNASI